MKKQILFILILLIPTVLACTLNNDFTLGNDIVICSVDGKYQNESNLSQYVSFDSTVSCKLSSSYENGTIIFEPRAMTLNSSHFEYNASDYINQSGNYKGEVTCCAVKGCKTKEFDFSVSKPDEGHRSGLLPSENKFYSYNNTILCEKSKPFVDQHIVEDRLIYTPLDFSSFQNQMPIYLGVGISENELRSFISNYDENCPQYSDSIKENMQINYWALAFFILIILLVIFIVGMIIYNYHMLKNAFSKKFK